MKINQTNETTNLRASRKMTGNYCSKNDNGCDGIPDGGEPSWCSDLKGGCKNFIVCDENDCIYDKSLLPEDNQDDSSNSDSVDTSNSDSGEDTSNSDSGEDTSNSDSGEDTSNSDSGEDTSNSDSERIPVTQTVERIPVTQTVEVASLTKDKTKTSSQGIQRLFS